MFPSSSVGGAANSKHFYLEMSRILKLREPGLASLTFVYESAYETASGTP